MPCDTVQRSKIQWTEKTDARLLQRAMEASGLRVERREKQLIGSAYNLTAVYALASHEMLVTRQSGAAPLNESSLKVAYAEEVLRDTAEQFGWTLEKTATGEFTMERETF